MEAAFDAIEEIAEANKENGRLIAAHTESCDARYSALGTSLLELAGGHKAIAKTVEQKFEALNKAGWRAVAAIAGSVLGGGVAIIVAVFLNGLALAKATISPREFDARTASHYSADDAARERTRQDERDAAILAALAKLGEGKR